MKTKLLMLFGLVLTLAVSLSAQTDPGTANLKHAWTFDGGTANDDLGKANGILTGGATVVAGDLVIDKTGEFVKINAGGISINKLTALSVSCWFSTQAAFTDTNNGFHMIWYFGGSEVDGVGGTALLGSNGIFFSPARGDDKSRTAISCGNIATPWSAETGIDRLPELKGDSTWHQVTTIDATNLNYYLNGALVGTLALAATNSIALLSNDNAWIGKGGYSGDPNFKCKVHEVKLYDKLLTADEVKWLYQHIPSGTDQIQNTLDVTIYSVDGNIYIRNLDNTSITSVKVYNIVGNVVLETNEFNGVINHNLPLGIYIVNVKSSLGEFNTKITVK